VATLAGLILQHTHGWPESPSTPPA
jgi:hypothetical protein